ncbi:MAG: GNAT family N-acetyltransferase [Clostridia bacterium]
MSIRYASEQDKAFLVSNDKWICSGTIQKKIIDKQILVAQDKENLIGWLRYGLFWDNVPFMYMLHLLDEYQGKGLGRKLVEYWENEMKRKGHKVVLTSTALLILSAKKLAWFICSAASVLTTVYCRYHFFAAVSVIAGIFFVTGTH